MDLNGIHIIHRGNYNYNYPENSIAAFRNTLSYKKPIELDIHILKDNTIIVFHDANLKRMCEVDIDIKNLTYDEISKYKLKNTIYKIPTLSIRLSRWTRLIRHRTQIWRNRWKIRKRSN